MAEQFLRMKPYPLGAHCCAGGIYFSFVSKKDDCGVILYDRGSGDKVMQISFSKEDRVGNVYCKYVADVDASKLSYQFYEEEKLVADERARAFAGADEYGTERFDKDLKAVFPDDDFDWEGDANPRIPYENAIAYCMHVRGFTKHASSGVKHKGTFRGIVEKIPYLKEIGVTTLELQPAYEFPEVTLAEELKRERSYMAPFAEADTAEKKINYWGYRKGLYYAPKAAYSCGDNPVAEFKTMVKELHKNGLEVVMQFYFPKEIAATEIPEILRFWVLEYHVDGFRLMGENIPADWLAGDPVLAHTKLWYYDFNVDAVYEKDERPGYCNLATYGDDFLYTMRKFLKGDEDMLGKVLYHMRHIPEKTGRIHYMSNYCGFTLKDMVSYERKHNEENGEENRDGNDYNCSWNCGEEGTTRKKKVTDLRLKQLKNAMCMLLFSQSTPLIFMGDEFGNSQQGNNNPYCQDNSITWLDWKDKERNKELFAFWKELVNLRKEHPVLRPASELRIMDYIACGYPDLSYHGENAWRPGLESYNRSIGIMYCGKYAKKDRKNDDDFFYIGMNMHWEPHELALPKLPRGLVWKPCIVTEHLPEKKSVQDAKNESEPASGEIGVTEKSVRTIPARSIIIFKSEQQND